MGEGDRSKPLLVGGKRLVSVVRLVLESSQEKGGSGRSNKVLGGCVDRQLALYF